MGRIGINEKELRRVEAVVRVKSKVLKLMDAASLPRPLCQVPRNTVNGIWDFGQFGSQATSRFEDLSGVCSRQFVW
jgi:hypothetical protein